MAVETELKFRVSSHDPTRRALISLAARPIGTFLETNWIMDHADGSLRSQGCGLRVRQSVNRQTQQQAATLTFKGPRASGPFKIREEIEIGLSNAERMVQVLGLLGLPVVLEYQKLRESWRHDECRIELDQPARIGTFVEIEGPDPAAIRRVQGQLGLSDQAVEDASYVELLMDHCAGHGIVERRLVL